MKHIRLLPIILMIFLILYAPVAEATRPPPHVDPSQLPVTVDPATLLTYYLYIFTGILNPGEYNISDLISLLNYSGYPSDIMYIVNRLNERILLLDNYLNETKAHIDRAELLMNYKVYDEALNELKEARYYLIKANMTYQEICSVLDELILLIGKYKRYTSVKKFYEARTELNKLLSSIDLLMKRLDELIKMNYENATMNYETYFENKTRTYILFKLNTTSIWVGESVSLNGILTTENISLPYRKIMVRLYSSLYIVSTNETGGFNIVLQVVNIYRSRVRLDLFYTPEGNDTALYMPSHNSTIIMLNYIHTSIDIFCDKIGYPGKPLNITIHISPSEIPRNTTVYIDDRLIESYQSIDAFNITYILPENTSLGRHILKAVVPAKDIYGGGLGIFIFTVGYKPVYLDGSLNTYFVIYPFTEVSVEGRLYTEGNIPLVNKTLEAYVGGQTIYTETDSGGRFIITFFPPPHIGSYEFNLYFKPDKPWFAGVGKSFSIFIFPLHLFLTIPVLIVALYYYIRRVGGKEVVSEGEEEFETMVEEVKTETGAEEAVSFVSHGPVSKYYMDILSVFSNKGYPIKSYETMREYYSRVKEYLDGLSEQFWSLSLLAEYEIFSGEKLSKKDVKMAEELYRKLLEGL